MKEIIEHLRFSVDYLEKRINFLDTKASILMALQVGLFAMVTFVLEKFFLKQECLATLSHILLWVAVISSGIIIALLLQTIRPSKHYLTRISGLPSLESPNITWPDMKDEPNKDRFMEKIDNWQKSDFEQDLKASVFVGHCLAYRKYKTYRYALYLAKLQILVIFSLFFLLLLI